MVKKILTINQTFYTLNFIDNISSKCGRFIVYFYKGGRDLVKEGPCQGGSCQGGALPGGSCQGGALPGRILSRRGPLPGRILSRQKLNGPYNQVGRSRALPPDDQKVAGPL